MARRRVAWVAALAAALTFSGAVAAKPKPKPLLPKQPTQEQIQAAYDRGRATGNWKLVRAAEHFDNGGGAALSAPLVAPPSRIATPPAHEDSALRAKLAVIGRHFNGWAAFWVHDLRTGTYAGWNSDAQFPSASIGKVAVLVAGGVGEPRQLAERGEVGEPREADPALAAAHPVPTARGRPAARSGGPRGRRGAVGPGRSSWPAWGSRSDRKSTRLNSSH